MLGLEQMLDHFIVCRQILLSFSQTFNQKKSIVFWMSCHFLHKLMWMRKQLQNQRPGLAFYVHSLVN